MKRILKSILHFIELLLCAVVMVYGGSILLSLVALIPAFISSCKFLDDVQGNKIKDSIFSVYQNGKIYQNTLAHPMRFLSIAKDKNKQERFVSEALNMFMQLDELDKKGNKKVYRTKSQSMTLMLLRTLEKNGYVENLEFEKEGKMHLYAEKVFMGNTKGFNKKYQMYQIEFNLTDKKRVKEEILSLVKKPTIKKQEPQQEVSTTSNIVEVQTPTIEHEVTKEELLKFKEELLSLKKEETEKLEESIKR